MKKRRRKFSTEFKLKLILESLKERESLRELANKYKLHPNQITKWKSDFIKNSKSYMSTSPNETEGFEKELEKLYAKIGRLQMENDYLKKRFS